MIRALAVLILAPVLAFGQSPAADHAPGFDSRRLELIGPLVEEAIRDGKLPGAVVVAGRGDKVLYRRAFGQRAVTPSPEPMTLDTIFDVASLTKVVATTTAVMALVEDGKIRLNDRVSAYITGFDVQTVVKTVRDVLRRD